MEPKHTRNGMVKNILWIGDFPRNMNGKKQPEERIEESGAEDRDEEKKRRTPLRPALIDHPQQAEETESKECQPDRVAADVQELLEWDDAREGFQVESRYEERERPSEQGRYTA